MYIYVHTCQCIWLSTFLSVQVCEWVYLSMQQMCVFIVMTQDQTLQTQFTVFSSSVSSHHISEEQAI